MKKSTNVAQSNFWANFFLTLGLLGFILFGFLSYQRVNPQNLSFDLNKPVNFKNTETEIAKPIGIKINSADIALPIIPAKLQNNHWESTTEGVSYLDSSVYPGEIGNSILYGHNWPNLLGNLGKVKPGETITMIYADNTARDFVIEYLATVSPSEISVLENSGDRRLTLYTCTGFLDSKRLVVVAKLLV